MVSEQVEDSESRGTLVEAKKSEVSCWNCFTTVAAETATNPEPATLPKIRVETRQKYKLYSFLASQLSRPKAIPLTQKVSENYAIGKKVEQKITEKAVQTNISQIEKIKSNDVTPDTLDSSPEPEVEVTRLDISVPETPVVDKEKKIQDYIREYHLFEAYKSIRRKTPTPNNTLERSKNNVTLDNSNVSNNVTNISVESVNSPNYKKLEIVQPKVTIRKVYESPSISITSNTYITQSQECLDVLDSDRPRTSKTVARVGKDETITSPKTPPPVTQRKSLPNPEYKASFPSPRSRTESNSSMTKSISPNDSPKAQHFVCKSLKIEDKNKGKSKSIPNMPLISPKKHTPTSSSENIVHKIKIETSTPKDSKSTPITQESTKTIIKAQDDIDTIIEGIQNITLEKDQRMSDKTDNASLNESESGYSGSSTRDMPETDVGGKNAGRTSRQSTESGVDTESPQLSHRIPRLHFKSSLPALASRHKDMSVSTKSLAADSNPDVNKPVKKLRWSTLGLPNDEVYLSDSSPGHATLPRRSNSPLPHERDMLDRDSRFSLNRSGLQNRSESMASVYSGAGEGTRCIVTVRGEVQFSLLYNYRLGALEVGVKRCRDLAPVDTKRNRSDPYVKVYLLPDKSKAGKRKTKVKKGTLSPVFEESLSFVQPLSSLSSRTLWLSVWHADMFGRNDFLGEVTLPLADVVFDDPAPMWYKLHERTEQFDEAQGTRGDLIVGLKFELQEAGAGKGKGTLHVLVKEAKNLVATKPSGLADVFCKSYLLPERGRLVKQKTSVCRRTLSPRWEQTFTYRGVRLQELGARALELSLWDRDRLASNDFMGAVRLSLGTGTYMGANVNWMDSAGKEVSLWQTMLERPNFWVEGSLPLRPQLTN